jgi:3-oxoacyl-[acyl-carrier protein] reductase
MQIDLTGKTALVTGGARDIGRAVSLELAASGAFVAVNYFGSADKADDVVKTITGKGGKAVAIQADVSTSAGANKLVEEAAKAGGGQLDILINNAGGLVARKKMDEMDEAFWNQVIGLNLTSVFLVTKAALTRMRDGGAIVNLASLAARDGGGGGAIAYSTAKGGVLTMTRGLAKELAPRKIRVNAVSPGLIGTTFHDVFTKPEIRQAVASRTAAGREGTAEDVARTIVFLASDAAAYITGESIEINGGLYFI